MKLHKLASLGAMAALVLAFAVAPVQAKGKPGPTPTPTPTCAVTGAPTFSVDKTTVAIGEAVTVTYTNAAYGSDTVYIGPQMGVFQRACGSGTQTNSFAYSDSYGTHYVELRGPDPLGGDNGPVLFHITITVTGCDYTPDCFG